VTLLGASNLPRIPPQPYFLDQVSLISEYWRRGNPSLSVTPSGRDLFQTWLDDLKDMRARVAIQRWVDRLSAGNFGDHKFCRDGISELRMDFGAGYRIYYAKVQQTIVLILCGGDKKTQAADIERAVKCLVDYQRRLP
jgi:putative addiction module killer protein